MRNLIATVAKAGILAALLLLGCGGSGGGNSSFRTGYYTPSTELTVADTESPDACVDLGRSSRLPIIFIGQEIDSKGISYRNFSWVVRGSRGEILIPLIAVTSDVTEVTFEFSNPGPFTQTDGTSSTICAIKRHDATLVNEESSLLAEAHIDLECKSGTRSFNCSLIETGTLVPEEWM